MRTAIWKWIGEIHARTSIGYKHVNRAVYVLYTAIALAALASTVTIWRQNEEQITCLARNIYWEARLEPRDAKAKVGLITLARVADPRWPETICDVVFENNQFSWTRNAELVLSHEPKDAENWQTSLEIARWLYGQPRLLLPPGWACARFYKRADNKGVSRAARDWFENNLIRVGGFGKHAAYAPKGGCKHPLPTT
jgi:hypothetical protein